MLLKLNEFETGKTIRVSVSAITYYKTIRVQRNTSDERLEATGIRFQNDPIMLVVTETADQIDAMLKESYHYIK